MQEPITAPLPQTPPPAEPVPVSPQPPVAEPRHWLSQFIRGWGCRWCLIGAIYVILQPPEAGLGKWGIPDLCTLHRSTGAPCPGCGMTRSGANLVRGNVVRSVAYHPLGLIFHPILFSLAILALLPYSVRDAVARGISRRARWMRRAEVAFLIAFLAFGVIRWVLVFSHFMAFPGFLVRE